MKKIKFWVALALVLLLPVITLGAFPSTLTNAVDGVTEMVAAHLNNLEAKVGVDNSSVATSLDYMLRHGSSIDPGHKHTPAYGGTGIYTYAVGDLLYASGATTLSKLADVAVGQVLVSGGVATAPAWSGTPTLAGITCTAINPLTTAAESWIGPSSTAGMYFKGGKVGIGTTNPAYGLDVSNADAEQARISRQRDAAPTSLMNVGSIMFGVDWTPTSTRYTSGEVRAAASETWTIGSAHGSLLRFFAVPKGATARVTVARLYGEANLVLGDAAPGTSAEKVFAISSGTAPSTFPADMAQMCVTDQAAGNAAFHFYTELGQIIKLYQQANIAAAKTDYGVGDLDSEAEIIAAINAANTKLNSILTILQNNGLMAAP